MESIQWLETYLINYKGSVLVVSHDRYFLDRIAQKIVELDHGKVTSFKGNYSDYSVKKAALRETLIDPPVLQPAATDPSSGTGHYKTAPV